MTRWVRSGNTQKHKKMPGNATKWGEFDDQKTSENSPKKQKEEDFERGSTVASVNSNISPVHENIELSNAKSRKQKRKKCKSGISREPQTKELPSALEDDVECETPSNNFEQSSNADSGKSKDSFVCENFDTCSTKVKSKKQKRKKNRSGIPCESQTKELSSALEDELECETPLNEMNSPEKSLQNSGLDDIKQNSLENGSPNSSATEAEKISLPKAVKTKKEIYLKKLQRKREKMGIMLLPPKIEHKLKRIRKRLQEKGYPPQVQKEILRKERRKEELLFRKTVNPTKLCFHCREPGHLFADCPKKKGHSNQETGICFKCGSSEHTSFKCPEKVQGFPFAKCFICQEQGHISKDCPQNKRGVYPKGGRCNLCGNVNHLKKDCPSLRKKRENEDSSITLHTINEATSMDAEVVEEQIKKKKVKRPKLVKF